MVSGVVDDEALLGVGPRSWAQADLAGRRTQDAGEGQKKTGKKDKKCHCVMMLSGPIQEKVGKEDEVEEVVVEIERGLFK